ncbi:MAG: hypothetical protein HPY70_13935 [Firmicutes bacterium]|nr:hypothetical protein [Bacillota bacterium]
MDASPFEWLGTDEKFTLRAMNELGITLIPARSPQAKGRVERLWETLQSRLPIEFKIAGIITVDQANVFLLQYMDKFNSLFAVEAQVSESAYRPISDDVDIAHVLCVKYQRTVDNGGVFSFYGKHFKVVCDGALPPQARIKVLVSPVFALNQSWITSSFKTWVNESYPVIIVGIH